MSELSQHVTNWTSYETHLHPLPTCCMAPFENTSCWQTDIVCTCVYVSSVYITARLVSSIHVCSSLTRTATTTHARPLSHAANLTHRAKHSHIDTDNTDVDTAAAIAHCQPHKKTADSTWNLPNFTQAMPTQSSQQTLNQTAEPSGPACRHGQKQIGEKAEG